MCLNLEVQSTGSEYEGCCVQVGRVFDVVEGVFERPDLGFKIADRSGEDVSLRNGTNIPVW